MNLKEICFYGFVGAYPEKHTKKKEVKEDFKILLLVLYHEVLCMHISVSHRG